MFNLLRMDLYRVFRNKSFYVCFGILIFVNLLTFGILFIITDPSARDFIIRYGAQVTHEAAAIREALSVASILDMFRQGTVAGGFYCLTLGILATLFVCMDFDSGYIKNILSAHENKWDYILSKTLCTSIINFLYLAGSFAFTLLLNVWSGGFFHYSSPADILFFLLCTWMIANGFCALSLLICMATRNKAAGVAGVFCLSSGMFVIIINSILGLFGLQWVMDYSLYMTLNALPASFDGVYHLRPVLTGLFFWVLYTVISKIVLSKKDI